MGGIRFKGFLLHQEVKAILENVWASIHDQPAPGPKIPLQTQIKNLQDFIKKREENQNLLRLQIINHALHLVILALIVIFINQISVLGLTIFLNLIGLSLLSLDLSPFNFETRA